MRMVVDSYMGGEYGRFRRVRQSRVVGRREPSVASGEVGLPVESAASGQEVAFAALHGPS